MDLTLTPDQQLLVRSARDVLAAVSPVAHVRAMEHDERGFSPEVFETLARLGWLGVALPAGLGGSGQTLLDAVLLLEQMGRVLLPTPYLMTAVVVAPLILALGSDGQRRRWLPRIAAGNVVATLALAEPGWRDESGTVETRARPAGDSIRIRGTKGFVPFARHADLMLVAVAIEGGSSPGTALVAVETGTRGVECVRQTTLGGDHLYEVRFADARVGRDALIGVPGTAEAALAAARARAATGSLAYAVGGAERVLELTLEHARTRVQFGRPIGSFQAVAHRCVDMRSDVDALRLLVYQAAWALARGGPAALEVGVAKAYGNDALRRIFTHAHQVFGAVGFSTEHDLQLFTRRAKAAELTWGSTTVHRERVAAAMGL